MVPGLALLAPVPEPATDSATGPHREAFLLAAALTVAGSPVGFANSVRELVKEQAIYARELAAGLSIIAYVGSKVPVHGWITVVQCLALVRIATLSAAGPDTSLIIPVPGSSSALTVAMASLALDLRRSSNSSAGEAGRPHCRGVHGPVALFRNRSEPAWQGAASGGRVPHCRKLGVSRRRQPAPMSAP